MPEVESAPRKGESPLNAKDLTGMRVRDAEKGKSLGKVHYFVFHPKKRVCVGFLIKRPDAALMFHRKDSFVAFDSFDIEEKCIRLHEGDGVSGASACRRLGIDLDECVIWQGMPVISESGEGLGYVEDVAISPETGKVEWITPHKGATADALLGATIIPRKYILGFKTGIGDELNVTVGEGDEEQDLRGAILVSDRALAIQGEGGLADKAGKSAAVAADKVRRTKEAAKPKVSSAAKKTEKAVNKGAYALGKQLSRSKGMFAAFKSEYDKAVADDSKRTKR